MSPSLVFEPTYNAIKSRLMQGAWSPGFRLDTARLAWNWVSAKVPCATASIALSERE